MSTRSGRVRQSVLDSSPQRSRKVPSPSRSPGRTRKTSPARKVSPGRVRKSPARRSPSRKVTSQVSARKSPSRPTKDEQTTIPKSPAKRAILGNVEVKLQDLSSKIESFRSVRSRRTEYSVKDLSSAPHGGLPISYNGIDNTSDILVGLRNRKTYDVVAPRRSGRLREFIDKVPDIRRSFSKSLSKSVDKSISKSIDTYSDEEPSDAEVYESKLKSVTRKLATPVRESINRIVKITGKWEFGGRIGAAVLILLIPITVFSILLSCSKTCSIQNFTYTSARLNLVTLFNFDAITLVLGQITLQAIITLIPIFGTKVQHNDTDTHFFNGLFASIITVNLIFALDFFKILNSESIINEYVHLAVANYVFSVILSIALYIKSLKADVNDLNPYGNTGYKLYDFTIGREILPVIKKFNIKLWTSRLSNVTSLVLAVLIFRQGFEFPVHEKQELTLENVGNFISKVQLKPTILVFSLMQIVYILNFIMKEYRIISTFYWQSEGMGYLQLASSALYPFFFVSISKFLADSGLVVPRNILIIAVSIYIIGFIIMSLSNSIKYEFRKNSLHPNLSHLESMPTFHGKKLLISHLWGLLRHPNYAGDILIHISLAIPGIISRQYIASVPALLTVLILLHRAWRDHSRCSRKYGAAWQRYCRKVPSVVIPKVL